MALSIKLDGELSGTGVRDAIKGGYLDLQDLPLSDRLRSDISKWQQKYEDAHFHSFEDAATNERLDKEGVELARRLKREIPDAEVVYYSSAYLRDIPLGQAEVNR
jgi:hypothetical protein